MINSCLSKVNFFSFQVLTHKTGKTQYPCVWWQEPGQDDVKFPPKIWHACIIWKLIVSQDMILSPRYSWGSFGFRGEETGHTAGQVPDGPFPPHTLLNRTNLNRDLEDFRIATTLPQTPTQCHMSTSKSISFSNIPRCLLKQKSKYFKNTKATRKLSIFTIKVPQVSPHPQQFYVRSVYSLIKSILENVSAIPIPESLGTALKRLLRICILWELLYSHGIVIQE